MIHTWPVHTPESLGEGQEHVYLKTTTGLSAVKWEMKITNQWGDWSGEPQLKVYKKEMEQSEVEVML